MTPPKARGDDTNARTRLIDAAEQLMLEDGYAAVTSRRVGQKAGLSPQLVHYYFTSMDDLYLEVYRRRAEEGLEHFAKAVASDRSLRELWQLSTNQVGSTFLLEFAALANHRKSIRAEIVRYAERFREIQLDALERALRNANIDANDLPPLVLQLVMTGLSQIMTLEAALGMAAGHDETVDYIERLLSGLDSGAD